MLINRNGQTYLVVEFQNCCGQQETKELFEFNKKTDRTLTEILKAQCAIGNFAVKFGLTYQD